MRSDVRCCKIFLHFALKRGNSFRWQSVGSRQDIANVPTNLFVLSRIALWLSLYCQECFPLNLLFYIRKALISGDPTAVLHSQDSSLQLQPLLRQSQYRGEEKPLRATTIINTALSSPACAPSSNLPQLLKDFAFFQFPLLCFITSTSVPWLCPLPLHQLFTIHIPILPAGQCCTTPPSPKRKINTPGAKFVSSYYLFFAPFLGQLFRNAVSTLSSSIPQLNPQQNGFLLW